MFDLRLQFLPILQFEILELALITVLFSIVTLGPITQLSLIITFCFKITFSLIETKSLI